MAERSSSRPDSEPLHRLPRSQDELEAYCVGMARIADNIVCTKGVYFHREETAAYVYPINGQYGLFYLHPESGEVVARCGFFVEGDNMLIKHTPQGTDPRELSGNSKKYLTLVAKTFRPTLTGTMVSIARSLGLQKVIGIGSVNHTKVESKALGLERAKEIIDNVYRDSGFSMRYDGNFEIDLTV